MTVFANRGRVIRFCDPRVRAPGAASAFTIKGQVEIKQLVPTVYHPLLKRRRRRRRKLQVTWSVLMKLPRRKQTERSQLLKEIGLEEVTRSCSFLDYECFLKFCSWGHLGGSVG